MMKCGIRNHCTEDHKKQKGAYIDRQKQSIDDIKRAAGGNWT